MSETKSDGGPAFPIPMFDRDGKPLPATSPGMSLRDWLAGMALAGCLGSDTGLQVLGEQSGGNMAADVARGAYRFADAMLRERDR